MFPLRNAADVADVGGKAAALGKMIRAKLPVPDGFVVPVSAFEEHVDRVLRKLSIDVSAADIAEAIRRTPFDETFKVCFSKAWKESIDSSAAVRSSATVEDSATASFAGQYHSELNVSTVDEAMKAVRRCWASLFSTHAVAYAKSQGGNASRPKMAVVVQQMVDAAFAGVAFTREPVTGSDDVFFAEWVVGLGESLVSGESVDGRVWLDRKGRVLRADYLRDSDAVPEALVWIKLVSNLNRVVKVFGPAQDVEWAWAKEGELFILQARPDTQQYERIQKCDGPPPWILPGRPLGGWTDDQMRLFDLWDEYNPPVVFPLDFYLFDAAIWQASLDMLDFGDGIPQIEQVVVLCESVPVMLDPAGRIKPPGRKFRRGRCASDFQSAMERLPRQLRKLEAEANELSNISNEGLVSLLKKAATLYRNIQVTRLLKGMDLWIEGEEKAKKTIRWVLRSLSVDVDAAIEVLEAGVDHETARMNQALRELAIAAAAKGKTRSWHRKLDDFMRRFGHFESGGTLVCEARESIIEQVDRMIEAGISDFPMDDPGQRAESLLSELKTRLSNEKNVRTLEDAVEQLRHWIALRENSKMLPKLPRPLIKRLQSEAGERLVQRRLIKQADQVMLLTPDELEAALRGSAAVETTLLERRSALIRWKREHPSWLPPGFLGDECRPDDPILYGIAASAGVAEGPAKIVQHPDEFGKVRRGEIVVARATNPVWTQLFTRIAGIVVENGSRLSHAAVVAREVGIPAVVGIPGLMKAIRNGERLRVNGSDGEVIRLDLQGQT